MVTLHVHYFNILLSESYPQHCPAEMSTQYVTPWYVVKTFMIWSWFTSPASHFGNTHLTGPISYAYILQCVCLSISSRSYKYSSLCLKDYSFHPHALGQLFSLILPSDISTEMTSEVSPDRLHQCWVRPPMATHHPLLPHCGFPALSVIACVHVCHPHSPVSSVWAMAMPACSSFQLCPGAYDTVHNPHTFVVWIHGRITNILLPFILIFGFLITFYFYLKNL